MKEKKNGRLKESTVNKIKSCIRNYPDEDKMRESAEYQNVVEYHMNWYEKEYKELILQACLEKKSYDEIRLLLKGISSDQGVKKTSPKTLEEKIENEAFYMVTEQKVVETDCPVIVDIGEAVTEEDSASDDNTPTQNRIVEEKEKNSVFMITEQKVVETDCPVIVEGPQEPKKETDPTCIITDIMKHHDSEKSVSSTVSDTVPAWGSIVVPIDILWAHNSLMEKFKK